MKKFDLRPKIVSVVTGLFILATLAATGAAQSKWQVLSASQKRRGRKEVYDV